MEISTLQEVFDKISKVKIAVYGDFCLDAYWIMDPRGSEVSVETGLQAEAVDRHYYSPGGAGNVVANVAALRPAAIKVIGVVGDDIYGRELSTQLQGLGADISSLVIQREDFDTYTYLKKHVEGEEQPRVDFGVYNRRSPETDKKILAGIRDALEHFDAMIFNQQVPGSLTNASFIDEANALFEEFRDKIVVLDSRHYNDKFRGVVRKVNDIELLALRAIHADPKEDVPLKEVVQHAEAVYRETGKPVFTTCGSRGIVAMDAEGPHHIPGIQFTSKLDTVGAGDTVISALTLCLAAGIAPARAAEVANYGAGVTVQKLYTTGTASREEILEVSADPSFVYQADLAEDIRQARYHQNTEIEICDESVLPELGHIKHAVFDHDGTISTLRQGWEEIMEPVMIKSILGEHFTTIDQHSYSQIVRQVRDYIDKTTGIQTIYQMEGLVSMVRDFGYVPEDQVLDKYAYKEIYNEALMEMVNARTEKVKSRELDVQDFTMKGAIEFLQGLKERGVKMYLASGTDVEDVINEAKILGYADLFDGGIYGAMHDVSKFSKKMIIEKIITDHKLQGNELAVFGDGPVEMRECRKFDGVAVGIASNEVRRFGLSEEKRTRIVKAGAQLLVPDWSQYTAVLKLLFDGAT
jgi:rfaE bifunctional protein kinase chain/domain